MTGLADVTTESVALADTQIAPATLRPARLPAWKRLTDLAVGGCLLAATAPVVLAAAAVRLTSAGPAIYRQTRLGRGGRAFTLYKLRSMAHDCEAATGAVWATRNDPRVTRVGAVLRRTHVDELPQLWNVLRGEMSLVGPRPERPELAAGLVAAVPGYADRLALNPGLTGLAQVQLPPDSDLESVRAKVRYDLHYRDCFGFWLDVRLLLATAGKVAGLPYPRLRAVFRLPVPAAKSVVVFAVAPAPWTKRPSHPRPEPTRCPTR